MTGTLISLMFVMILMVAVPALVTWLIWRAVRRMLKNNAVIGATGIDVVKLRELVAQARAQQSERPAGSVAPAPSATAAPSAAAIAVSSTGRGTNIVAYLFTAIGLSSAAVAAITGYHQAQFLKSAVHAEGRVVRNVSRGTKSGYYPVVRFEPEGGEPVEFEGAIGNRPAQFEVGEPVSVVYLPSRPEDAKINHWMQLWFAPLFGGFFTLIFGGIGVGLLIPALRQRARARWAAEQGMQTFARFCGVERDRTTRVNGRSPFKVLAEWRNPVDGKLYRFQSQNVFWSDPSDWLRQHPEIPLRVDPQQPRRYRLEPKLPT